MNIDIQMAEHLSNNLDAALTKLDHRTKSHSMIAAGSKLRTSIIEGAKQ